MRAIVQRVSTASVVVDGRTVGSCSKGLLVLLGVHRLDTSADAAKLADRLWGLRIFPDGEGRMNLALKDLAQFETAEALLVSNFTVYGETAKNRRPSFTESAPYDAGKALFDEAVQALRILGARVETGEYGAHMDVSLVNDGPVTVVVEVGPSGTSTTDQPVD